MGRKRGEFKGELPGATALKTDKKDETQEREKPFSQSQGLLTWESCQKI